jgi:hypothetical protein
MIQLVAVHSIGFYPPPGSVRFFKQGEIYSMFLKHARAGKTR